MGHGCGGNESRVVMLVSRSDEGGDGVSDRIVFESLLFWQSRRKMPGGKGGVLTARGNIPV